jgi:pimeloyl-ACP methyl ester carboxylesterase
MYSVEYGQGNTLVLIHGFCEDSRVWEYICPALAKENRIITIDMPGFGKSPLHPKQEATTLEDMADQLSALLAEKRIKKCTMVGHSMGGYLTLAFAEKYADMLNGFGLFHSTAFADSDFKKKNRLKHIDFVEKNGVEPFVKTLIPSLYSSKQDYQKQVENSLQMANECSVEGVANALKAMRQRADKTEVLKNSQVPVLFIAGTEDTVVVPKDVALQSSMPKMSQFELFENSGHMGMTEEPERSIKTIRSFLSLVNA